VPASTNLNILAQASDTSIQYLRYLNPNLRSNVTPPEPYIVNVPAGKANDVVAVFKRLPASKINNTNLAKSVNGETWQDSSTAEMVFDVPTIIAFASRTITLEPGDIIATGTPAGVGHFQGPPRYLHHGDRLRCEIEGIGALENTIVDELPRADDHATAAGVAELLELAR